jgi:hypothetical protein
MTGSNEHLQGSRADLLLEHVAVFGAEREHPPAHERLERLVGDYLARLLVGALAGGRRERRLSVDG